MSEAVKRYWLESYVDGFYKARQFVLASDHDRIVAGLQAQVERLAAKRDQWQREAIRLASAVCALGKMEFDQLTDDSKLIEVMSVVREAIQERDTLRAEAEELRKSQGAEMFLTLTGEITGLRAEVERLRKDAERYRWARRPESGNALFTLTGSGECGPNMDSAIDAAMEASL